MAIAPEDLTQFIREKWKEEKCPRCFTTTWNMGEPGGIKGVVPVSEDGSGYVLGPKHIPLYWLACDNCGHVEWIAAEVVRGWKRER